MTATYNMPPVTDVDQVRLRLGDTNLAAPLFQNEEIQAAINLFSPVNWDSAVTQLQKWAINRSANFVDFSVADARFSLSQRQKGYVAALEQGQAGISILPVSPFGGGISRADKTMRDLDTDRVDPLFTRAMGNDPSGDPEVDNGTDETEVE